MKQLLCYTLVFINESYEMHMTSKMRYQNLNILLHHIYHNSNEDWCVYKFPDMNWKAIDKMNILKLMLKMWKFVSRQFVRLRFRWKIWGFTLKKLKLGWDPRVDGPLRKILKHQIKVDSNTWWSVPVSFPYDNLHWNK